MGGITLDPKYAVSPPMRAGLAFDPVPLINRIKCPVLALNGDKDVQVPATENLQGLIAAFKAAGNSRVVIKKMANLNHLFQTVLPGGPTDYCQIEETSKTLMEKAIDKLGLSARAFTRILKIARTIADLEGVEDIATHHISESIQYRSLDRTLL